LIRVFILTKHLGWYRGRPGSRVEVGRRRLGRSAAEAGDTDVGGWRCGRRRIGPTRWRWTEEAGVRWERRRLAVQTEEARAGMEEVDGEGWGVAGTEKAGLVTRLGGGREVVQTEEAGVQRR
jgi:hypothetical protein